MNKKIIRLSIILFIGHIFIFPNYAQAVIPPDFIFNIGTQIAQFFSLAVIFFTAILGTFFQFFKTKFYAIKYKKSFFIFIALIFIFISLMSSYFYALHRQKAEYKNWLAESKLHDIPQEAKDLNNEKNYQEDVDGVKNKDENDQLNIGTIDNQNIDTSLLKFVSKVDISDSAGKFISEYYGNIANGNLDQAYEMSKKTTDLYTFKSWYNKTTKITLDSLVRIDNKKSSIELTLYEGAEFTRYGVLMTLAVENSIPVKIEKSEVKILSQGSIEKEIVFADKEKLLEEYEFFGENEERDIVLTNQSFKSITESKLNNYIVLDAREDIEYENGYFPGSLHIRFADLKAGRWIELPKDKYIYVICWSGIRGKEVAEFLRTKKSVASYLEKGANGWVEFGGEWTGGIKFGDKYLDSRYQVVFNTEEVRDSVKEGVILIDTREPYKYKKSHINGSINIPIMYTPTIDIENVFNQVPAKSRVITVCDAYVNCFDAKITGVELERRGNQFLGRYNKPWEYEK